MLFSFDQFLFFMRFQKNTHITFRSFSAGLVSIKENRYLPGEKYWTGVLNEEMVHLSFNNKQLTKST